MDKLVAAYETESGDVMKQVNVEDRSDAFSAVLEIAEEEGFHIKDIDFDKDGYTHGYNDDDEKVADFMYVDMEEYRKYKEEFGDDYDDDEEDEEY